ncbi:DUF469 family protein [Paenibacillus sp. N10]|uniref:DUF469 family protein n=1 Tax=Paenibacillus lutrae TaxID=2078573 RepID=A0A7X3K165_9BACL|nr:DUF469 family protein [Paenibacillus lutrae]
MEINGTVFANKGNLNHDEFLDKFIEFVEANGWQFGGGTKQINEDGD